MNSIAGIAISAGIVYNEGHAAEGQWTVGIIVKGKA